LSEFWIRQIGIAAMLLAEIKQIKGTTKEIRRFGLTSGIFLLMIAGGLFWQQRTSFLYFVCFGGGFAFIALAVPILVKPIYVTWMTFAAVIGFVMTRVILGILFFGVFTLIALVAKLLRHDLLNEHWDKWAETYWVKRPPNPFDPKAAENMF
jgi:hypothetical protein